MQDRLTLKGLGAADGDYEFELADLVSVNGSGALNLREQQRVKLMSGYRGLEIREAVSVLDPSMMVALVAVLVARGGKTVNEQRVWDAKMLYTSGDETADMESHRIAVNFHMADLVEAGQGEGDEDDPPA